MRITIVLGPFKPPPPAPSGAVEKVWWSLAQAFAARGHETTLLGPDHPDLPREEVRSGVRLLRMPLLSRSRHLAIDLARDLPWSLRALRRLPPATVTVTNCLWLPGLLGWAPRTRRRIGVLHAHVQRFPKGQMRLYRGADRISTVSQAVADGIAAEQPRLAGRIVVIPNPVDLAVFRPRADRVIREPLRLLYTGRIHPEKGLHLLVAAWRSLVERGAAIELHLVGPSETAAGGGGETYLRRLREAAGGRAFTLAGAIADPAQLAEALRDADLYCYPSTADRGEALPVAPLEAMACGLAPVVMDLPQYEGLIEPDGSGLVVRCGGDEVAALAAALSRLVADPALRDRLGRAARETAAARLGIDAVAEAYLEEFAASLPSART